MANYIVTYDLVKQRDYQAIYDAMAKIDATLLLESVWLINVSNTAAQVRDWMKGLTDNDDRVAVVEINGDWATIRVEKSAVDWLKSHL